MRIALAAAARALALPAPVSAEHWFFTAGEFEQRCGNYLDKEMEGEWWGTCFGYLTGVVDRDIVAQKDRAFCVPVDTTIKDWIDTVLNYIRAHPKFRKEPTVGVVMLAFRDAYPCSARADGGIVTPP